MEEHEREIREDAQRNDSPCSVRLRTVFSLLDKERENYEGALAGQGQADEELAEERERTARLEGALREMTNRYHLIAGHPRHPCNRGLCRRTRAALESESGEKA